MIIEYHRPQSIEEALALISRNHIKTLPLGGGTVISRMKGDDCAVVDLQSLDLDSIVVEGDKIVIGASTPLQKIADDKLLPQALRTAAKKEKTSNLRQMASIAGTLVTSNGRSVFSTVMLALDAVLNYSPGNASISIGDWLPIRASWQEGKLIEHVTISSKVGVIVESVSRSPEDLPILSVAVGKWSSGRTRIVVGGFGNMPVLAMDGPDAAGADVAASSVCTGASDNNASADYRQEVAGTLVRRILKKMQ